ncbi:MAG: hypothetical protein K6F53_02930 [Lachnospiraceae bacterium]|nr:hypothetical protein [Lachnospiraceae bacterium]
MGFFDAKNRYHKTETDRKKADSARIAVILISCAALIAVSFTIRFLYEKDTDKEGTKAWFRDGDYGSKMRIGSEDEVSKEWVKETIGIYTGNMATEDEVRKIVRSLNSYDDGELTADPENLSDEDLRRLYIYIDEKISQGLKEIPDENRTALTENMVLQLIGHNRKKAETGQEKAEETSGKTGPEDEKGDEKRDTNELLYEDLLLRLREITREISLLKENGIGLSDLKTLTEDEIQKLIQSEAIGKDTILSWIKASEECQKKELEDKFRKDIEGELSLAGSQLINAFQSEDEVIRKEMRKEDEKIMELLNGSSQRIDELTKDADELRNNTGVLKEAERKIELMDEAILILNDSMEAMAGERLKDRTELLCRIADVRDELSNASMSLRNSLNAYEEECERKTQLLTGQMTDTLREEYEKKLSMMKQELDGADQLAASAISLMQKSIREIAVGFQEDFGRRFESAETKIQNAESRIQRAETGIQNAESRIQNAETGIQNAESRIQRAETEIQGSGARIQDAESRIRNAESGIESIGGRLDETGRNIEGLTEDLRRTGTDLNILRDGISGNSTALNELKKVFGEISETIGILTNKTDAIGDSLMRITEEDTLDGALLKLPNLNMNGDAVPGEVLKGRTFTNREGTGLEGTMEDHRGNITAGQEASSIRLMPGFYDGIIDLTASNTWQYEKGKGEGYGNGYEDGYAGGTEDGYNSGYAEGLGDGYDSGYTKGRDDGHDSGYQSGREDGRNEVIADPVSFGIGTGYSRCILEGTLKAEASAQSASKKKLNTTFTITIDLKNGEISQSSVSVSGTDHTEFNNTQDLVGSEYSVKGKAVMTITAVRFE